MSSKFKSWRDVPPKTKGKNKRRKSTRNKRKESYNSYDEVENREFVSDYVRDMQNTRFRDDYITKDWD
jgi:hypothetical protein